MPGSRTLSWTQLHTSVSRKTLGVFALSCRSDPNAGFHSRKFRRKAPPNLAAEMWRCQPPNLPKLIRNGHPDTGAHKVIPQTLGNVDNHLPEGG